MRLGVAIFIIGWLWFCVEALILSEPSYPRQIVAVGLVGLGYYVGITSHNKLTHLAEQLSDEGALDENNG